MAPQGKRNRSTSAPTAGGSTRRARAATLQPGADGARPVRVLVADDEQGVRDAIAVVLDSNEGIEVVGSAGDGAEAVRLAEQHRPDVVVMDVEMPRMDGCQATDSITRRLPDTRVIALTGHTEGDSVTRMIVAGAVGYAVKGSDPDILAQAVLNAATRPGYVDAAAVPGLFESVVRLAREESARREEAERLAAELDRSYEEIVRALVTALRSRDLGTEEHGDRVANRVLEVGRRLGLSDQQLLDLEYGAIFHDIGKIGVPDSILYNTDELTEAEWGVIRQHTIVGEQIVRQVGFLRNVARIVRHSHEHWDGSGYPDGLRGEAIPIESRIIFACDAFDAMTSERTYQHAMQPEAAAGRMRELAGRNFDERVVDVLLEVVGVGKRSHSQPSA